MGASTADSIEGSSVLTYDGNKVKLGNSADTANYFEVEGSDSENTYDVFVGRRRFPRISLNDRGSYTMQIWALGSELRFGTSAGSNTNAAFVIKSGSAAGAYTFGKIGIMIRLQDKINRYINVSKNNIHLVEDESLDDTIKDLINYSYLFLIQK